MTFIRLRTIPPASRSPLILLVASFLAIAIAPAARAQEQQPDVRPLATQVTAAIEQSGAKSIVIFDFTGPGSFVTPVGGRLADDLNDLLAQSNAKFKVVDRSRAVRARESNRLAPEITADPELAVWLAGGIGAAVVLVGRLSRDDANLRLRLDCLRVYDGKLLQSLQAAFPLSDKLQSDLAINIDPDSAIGAPRGSSASQSPRYPQCVSCPYPEFPRGASTQKSSERVVLNVVVGTDGKARDISVLNAPESGFSLAAIQAVQKWKFKPAQGPDGKSIEARTVLEVSFVLR